MLNQEYVFASTAVPFYDAQLVADIKRRVRKAEGAKISEVIACPVCGNRHVKVSESSLFCKKGTLMKCEEVFKLTVN